MTIVRKSAEEALAGVTGNRVPITTYNWESQHLAMRSNLLSGCDWTQVADSPLSDEKKAQWAEYRQKLRDLTKQENWPNAPEWPLPPID
jgi:hypothetical protein